MEEKRAYETVIEEINKPIKERKAIILNPKGIKRVPRKYSLTFEEVIELANQWKTTKKMPNPYKRRGTYQAFVQALINLGINKKHTFAEIKEEMKNILSNVIDQHKMDLWTKFSTKQSRNVYFAKDINGRIMEVPKMLQRINGFHPYGYPLLQLHCCIDIVRGQHGIPRYRLNAYFRSRSEVQPINELIAK